MHNYVDAPYCEFIFKVTDKEALRFLLLPQYCTHAAKRESTPHGLVLLLDVVYEVQMVGPAQDDHLFCCRSPVSERHDPKGPCRGERAVDHTGVSQMLGREAG
jgi:hypothetical protein